MKSLIELLVALAALVGAEARSVRHGLSHWALAFALAISGALLLAAGVGAIVYSLYRLLAYTGGLPVPGAAAICGGILLLIGIPLLLIGSRLIR